MGKVMKIASAAVLATFAGLAIAGSAQAASGGKSVCIKPHKKFLKTQCGSEERRRQYHRTLQRQQGPIVNFRAGPIQTGPAAGQLNGSGGGRGGSRGGSQSGPTQ